MKWTISRGVLGIALLWVVISSAQSQEVIRAAFDVGSGATKMKVYRYDTIQDKIIEQIKEANGQSCEQDRQVSYGEDLSFGTRILEDTLQEGIRALSDLKRIAIQCGAEEFSAVATEAFRAADNGSGTVVRLYRQTGIFMSVISQAEEAQLGFRAALARSGYSLVDPVCVWDIGASSMQITCSAHEDGRAVTYTYQSLFASVSFKNDLILMKQYLNGAENDFSPNPITRDDYLLARGLLVNAEATKILSYQDGLIFRLLRKSVVLGIGGVHNYAIAREMGQHRYSLEGLSHFLQGKLSRTDEELGGGDYVDTAVSNLILVEGLMSTLGVDSVESLSINLADGLVSSRIYW